MLYASADTDCTRVVLAYSRTPLNNFLSGLDAQRFWHVHGGTIVNVDAVSGALCADAEKQYVRLQAPAGMAADLTAVFHWFKPR